MTAVMDRPVLDAAALLAGPLAVREPCPPPGAPPGFSWWPQRPTPRQHAFLLLPDREVLFGGQAGGGKSSALLMAASQYVCVPGYDALLLRKTFPQLADAGGLVDRAKEWWERYIDPGWVSYNEGRHRFEFAGGGRITLGFANRNADRWKFQSSEYQYVGFDELTHWPDGAVYRYVGFSRVRRPAVPCAHCRRPVIKPGSVWEHASAADGRSCRRPAPGVRLPACPSCGFTIADVPLRLRSGTNPGGRGHQWVKSRWGLGRKGEPPAPDVRRFVRSSIGDNPHLDAESYVAGLAELDRVERGQLLSGDWDARQGGAMFDRDWFLNEPDPSWLLPSAENLSPTS